MVDQGGLAPLRVDSDLLPQNRDVPQEDDGYFALLSNRAMNWRPLVRSLSLPFQSSAMRNMIVSAIS